MSKIKEKCEEYFGTSDFYQVLNVEKGASEKEIKKAYHKLSLLVHPDRVPEEQKEIATEKFKVLGKIHLTLQNKEKRKAYDDFGEWNEEDNFNWMDYWHSMFRKIELSDIDKYKEEYLGSDLEKYDIKRAYVGSKGDMDFLYEYVSFASVEHEQRYIDVVQKMVDDGEVEYFHRFFNENKRKQKRRFDKYQREKEEVEELDLSELSRQMEINNQKRAVDFGNMLKNLEEKYTKKKTPKRKSITNGENSSAKKTRKNSRI